MKSKNPNDFRKKRDGVELYQISDFYVVRLELVVANYI